MYRIKTFYEIIFGCYTIVISSKGGYYNTYIALPVEKELDVIVDKVVSKTTARVTCYQTNMRNQLTKQENEIRK